MLPCIFHSFFFFFFFFLLNYLNLDKMKLRKCHGGGITKHIQRQVKGKGEKY